MENSMVQINVDFSDSKPTVSGRELHEALGIETPYRIWFPRMCEYGFTDGEEYTPYIFVHPQNKQETTDHTLTIAMAKELCMIQRTELGRQFRKYFIAVEEQWNSPEMVMQRALTIANERVKALQANVAQLTLENTIMQPKAEYFDELVERKLLTGFRETAKELHLGQKEFVTFLLDNDYVYRNKKGKLQPYMQYVQEGLFEVKEYTDSKSGHSGTQTLITPKGKETFRLLTKK